MRPRPSRTRITLSGAEHGTHEGFQGGCRCGRCVRARTEWLRTPLVRCCEAELTEDEGTARDIWCPA